MRLCQKAKELMKRTQNVCLYQQKNKCSLCLAITNVLNFTYQGSLIKLDGKWITEIDKRIGIAKEVFHKMNAVFKNRHLKVKTRTRVL